ncbi:uncharacterized protein DSM5745_06735 [Aspergillus mulundensis]|uniref:Uncharacterized protein n=1 Tax=Aspergillus mulundensis TaxID=1810919 RepID=A0A3D8RRP0_9EURO|nr:hypothetical protein DSM5745_06735 [Aspergillus mulundensis]RDW76743.1 hypothetical protein DSM5745_06735 [Aspergillus mulundensis]
MATTQPSSIFNPSDANKPDFLSQRPDSNTQMSSAKSRPEPPNLREMGDAGFSLATNSETVNLASLNDHFVEDIIDSSSLTRTSSVSQLSAVPSFDNNPYNCQPNASETNDLILQQATADTATTGTIPFSQLSTELTRWPAVEKGYSADSNTKSTSNTTPSFPNVLCRDPKPTSTIPPQPENAPVLPGEARINGEIRQSSQDPSQTTNSSGGCQAQCHIAILHRLASMEHSIAIEAGPTTIDFILIAQQDLCLLSGRLFNCRYEERDGCLHSRPSSIISLGLLAEQVVLLLEDLFRRAARAAHDRDHVFRTTWLVTPDTLSEQSAVRFERSTRGIFDQRVTCPIPEANSELSLGRYKVPATAKARAMKQILRRRIRQLLGVLADVAAYCANRDTLDNSAILEAARRLAEELHGRVGSLQGRVELAG